jgi:hypothetical protein
VVVSVQLFVKIDNSLSHLLHLAGDSLGNNIKLVNYFLFKILQILFGYTIFADGHNTPSQGVKLIC